MIQVDFPLFFIIIPVFIILSWVFFREKMGFTPPNPFIEPFTHTPTSIKIIFIFRIIFIVLITSLLAGTHWMSKGYTEKKELSLTTIILDISRSMLAEDIKPSRISVAKNALSGFLMNIKDRETNLIIFSGKPFLLVSHSTDTFGIIQLLNMITPYSILQEKPGLSGTNIGDALLLAIS